VKNYVILHAHPNSCPRYSAGRQGGTTLLEILVSLVVIALGLLGLASLQAISLKSNNTAYYRSQATILAYDISDRMRANRTVAVNSASYNIDFETAASSNTGVAGTDVNEWKQNIARAIPSGQGKITVLAGGIALIEIRWDSDSNGTIDETDVNFSTMTRL